MPVTNAAEARRAKPDWPAVRLHVVTGKGGTGKTTVAAALAFALANDHARDVALIDFDPQG